MPRVDVYQPNPGNPGNISSSSIETIASTPSNGDILAAGMKPVQDYVQKTTDQRNQTETLAKMSNYELNAKKRLNELQQTDLGDQNIGDVYSKEMSDQLQELRNTIDPRTLPFFDEHAVSLRAGVIDESINAQANQNASRIKLSAATFSDNMQKMAITDPANVTKYADQINTFTDTLGVSKEAKEIFRKSAIDSVYDAQATSLKNTDPEQFWNLYKNGFYNDKVTPETLAKMQTYRGDAEQVFNSRAMVAASQATNAAQIQPVIEQVQSSSLLQEQTKNTLLSQLFREQKGMMSDVIAKSKDYERGVQILNGTLPLDTTSPEYKSGVDAVYTAQRAAVIASFQSDPTATDDQKGIQNQKADAAIGQLTMGYVRNYNVLPPAAVGEIGRKLGNYSNPAAINDGMTQLGTLVKQAPVVLSSLPKEMATDYNTFQMYADKYGNDEGQAAQKLIDLKRMTVQDQKLQTDMETQADLQAETQFNSMARSGLATSDASILRQSSFTIGKEGDVSRAVLDPSLGWLVRFYDRMATNVVHPELSAASEAIFQDGSAPDLKWLKSRWQQQFRNGFMGTNGTDPTLAARNANEKVQQEFGVSSLTGGHFSAGKLDGPRLDVMWMPPEKVLDMHGIKSPSILSRTGTDWDVIKRTMEAEMRFIDEPITNVGGAPMLGADGKPKTHTIDLWQRNGMMPNMDMQDIRLTTTAIDKQTKSTEDFAAHPVYGMEFLDKNKMWQTMTNGKGQPVFVDFMKVIDKIKKEQ